MFGNSKTKEQLLKEEQKYLKNVKLLYNAVKGRDKVIKNILTYLKENEKADVSLLIKDIEDIVDKYLTK